MAVEAGEPVYLYCVNCATWIVEFSEEHHTTHKDHDIITEKQVMLQAETKTLIIESGHPKESKYYVDIPLKIINTGKASIEKLPSAKVMGDLIIKKYHWARIRDDRKELLIKENRVFRPNGVVILEKIITESTGELWPDANPDKIIKYIMSSEPHERAEFDQDRMILNCKNCFVNLREYEVIKNPDQIYSLLQINTKYIPRLGRSKIFEKMISECTPKHELLLEIIACSLTRQEINPEQIVMAIGDMDNGKSTLIRILKAVFGVSVISSIKIQDIQHDPNAPYHLEHKLLNISGELPDNTPLESFDELKKITTTGEMQSVQDKYKSRHEADIYATMLFFCNELPDLPSISNSIYKRLTVIPFPVKFPKDDEYIEQFLTEEEKSRILNTLLYYLDRVTANKRQPHRPTTSTRDKGVMAISCRHWNAIHSNPIKTKKR